MWLLLGSVRIREFSWVDRYRPWGVSPISFLELAFLREIGRIELAATDLISAIRSDKRFVVDDPPLLPLIVGALPLDWTRDPFDRLLAAHSSTRRTDLCTTDRTLRAHHRLIVRELR